LRVFRPPYLGVFINRIVRIAVVCLVFAGLIPVVVSLPASASSAPGRPRSVPELLDAAVASGEVDRATADLHLARAFAGSARFKEVPSRFQSTVPWHGTMPLFRLKQRLAAMPPSPTRSKIAETIAPAATTTCGDSSVTLANQTTSTRFYVEYGTIGGGLTITDYLNVLEQSWTAQITNWGWAAPPVKASSPPPGNRYAVRVDSLGGGLYGYVTTGGTYAGAVGDNPNTPWNDVDADASCMVLNSNYTGFPGSPLRALQATAAHELNHSIQFGLGVQWGPNVPDDSFFEGIATWMEDEVFDSSNDNWHYLWPVYSDSMGDYDGSSYEFWILMRGLTERFGISTAGGGEQVMQDFWELTSKGTHNNLSALAAAVAAKGITLADAYHQEAIGTAFMRTCGGGYVAPFCFEEAAGYIGSAGMPPSSGTISSVGGSLASSLEDDYSMRWFAVPSGNYAVTLSNTSTGGQLRASAVCDTGSGLVGSAFPAVVGGGGSTTLAGFNASGCVRQLVVVTNQQQSPGNPSNSPTRGFTLSTAASAPGAPTAVSATGGNASARVTWAAPASNGGSPITGYTVTSTPGGVTAGVGAGVLAATVTGLTNGTSYTFTVRASNSIGAGAVSAPSNPVTPRFPAVADFDGDRDTDLTVFRPGTGQWFTREGATTSWGLSGDVPVAGDYNNDGSAEPAIFRPSVGGWYISGQGAVFHGLDGDLPVPGDYDRDGDTDVAVYRPSTGQWFVKDQFTISYGLPGDIPVPGDYDKDGDTDVAIFRPSTGQWFVRDQFVVSHGLPGDIPVPGDYDGDGDTDVAIYRPEVGGWYVKDQPTSFYGLSGDVPVQADYDADGDADVAVFRPSTGQWFVKDKPTVSWGLPGDIPAPAQPGVYRTFFTP
jgi:hypothetical protein